MLSYKSLDFSNMSKTFKSKVTKTRLDIAKESKSNRIKSIKGIHSFHFRGNKKLQKKLKKIGLLVLGVFLILFSIGGIVLLSYLQDLNDKLPTPDAVFPETPLASEIYDRKALEGDGKGTRLYRVFNKYNSDPVDIKQVPEIVKWSFLAAEDIDFYNHKGFDPAGILRCGLSYVRNTGGSTCGGSTITQQLVKITQKQTEVKLERKIKELLLALKVENAYQKDQILEMYLRVTPFGSSIYGVRTAANFYFGKEPKDLDLAESAMLAAIIQDPVRLSPTLPGGSLDKAKVRQSYVLDQMQKYKDKINSQNKVNHDDPELDDILTDEMLDNARNEELKFRPAIATDKKAGHFVDFVLNELSDNKMNYKNGTEPFTLAELQNGGYKIYTSLDYDIQKIAEDYVSRAGNDYSYYNAHNAAVMTVSPANGQIIAMAGSKDYNGKSEGCDANGAHCVFNPQVNIFTSLQSPGSQMKPMGYYEAYKEGKLFTGSLLPDIPIKFADGFEPKNWNGGFMGPHNTAEEMLRASRNIPAYHVIQMIGVENYVKTGKEFGYSNLDGQQLGPSVILGGADIYLWEHVQAYGVFANGGDYVPLNPIMKIVDKNGNTVYEAKPERKQVADQQAVYLINQTLKNYDGFSWDQRELGGKTGTTEENKDALFMVYSPDFVSEAWVGNNNNSPMDPNNGYPPIIVKPWFQNYMRDIGEAPYFSAKTAFSRPGYVLEGGGDCDSTTGLCLGLKRGWMIQDRVPAAGDVKKVKVMVCKDQMDHVARPIDIAVNMAVEAEFYYYSDPVPDWQKYVDNYMMDRYNKDHTQAPNGGYKEPCTIDRTGGVTGPFFTSLTASITGTNINIKGALFTTNGSITSLTFTLNGTLIPSCAVTNYASFDITCNISTIAVNSGANNTLTVKAKDDQNLTNTKAMTVQMASGLSLTPPPAALKNGQNIGTGLPNCATGCDQTISFGAYTGGWTLGNTTLHILKNNVAYQTIIITSLPGSVKWGALISAPAPGTTDSYVFYITATTQSGGNLNSGNSAATVVSP